MKKNKFEAILGVLVLVIVGIFLFYSVKIIGNSSEKNATPYNLTISFSDVGDLQKGSDVKMSGVRIGGISDIILDNNDYKAKVTINFNSGVQIPKDSLFSISSAGLTGGSVIQIKKGDSIEYFTQNSFAPEAKTQDFVSLEQLVSKIIFLATE